MNIEDIVKEAVREVGLNLTSLEKNVLKEFTQDNFFDNGLDSVIWVDEFIRGTSSAEGRIVRGVLSSLVKKGYIYIDDYERGQMVMGLRDKGKNYLIELAKTDDEVARAI